MIGPPLKTPSAQVLRDIVSISQGQLKALFMPPSVAEQLLQELDGLALFRGIDFLCYAGGPLSQNAGDLLSGVTGLCQYYGSTETFQVQQLVPHPRDWAYMEWHPQSKIQMQPYSMENNVYELVVIPDESTAVYHIYPDLREYRTKDLFEQHPTKEKLWRFYGKTDDIIVLSNGQKVNPIPMEASLQANPMITRALVLGQGKPQVALLVELQHERQEEPAMFITDNLWTLIDRVNAQFPAHSRITRSKIIIGNSDKPLTCSAKGTILRKATAAAYENEVNLLYETELIKCASSISNLEKIRDQASIKDLVKASVGSLLPEMEFLGHEDLYSSGLDSLKTVELIQILQERLSNLTNEPPSFPNDFVYRNSTIDALSSALCRFLDISPESPTDMPTSPFSVAAMIEKYTADLGSGITVILTGSSGSLGSYILYELLHEPRITKIYCLDRSLHVKEKLMETYAGRYEDLSCINDTKVVFTQVDLTQKQFGLSISEFNELLHQTDIVIHNAWMVDFNMRLQSFEPLIQGVRSLIDFSIQSDRHSRIVFVSSVSSVQNASTQKVPQTFIEESILDDIDIASGTGYGESKYVAERILAIAHEMRQVPVSILRVGQIAGPIRTCGVWPSREWVPSLIQTSKTLSLLPEIDRAIDWIPIDTMAKVVLDISLSTNVHGLQVYNLINPSTTPWKTFLNPLHHELGLHVKVVPLVEWVGELERHDANDVAKRTFMPALKFLPFFRSIESATNEKHFITHNAVASSKTMAELGPVSEEWVMSWVQQLKCTWV